MDPTSLDPRVQMIHLLEPIPKDDQERELPQQEITARVERVGSLLQQNPQLRDDPVIAGRIFILTQKSEDEDIKTLGRKVLFNSSYKEGVLTLSEEVVKEFGEDFWETIELKGIQKLVIKLKEGGEVVYEPRVLQQFLENPPPIEDLSDMYTLKFERNKETGKIQEMQVSKAILCLCGDYLKRMVQSKMGEAKVKTIDFTKRFEEFYDAFDDLLNEVKTGEREMEDDVYQVICEELIYTEWYSIPEGAFGPEQWEEHYGVKIDKVPPVPKELLEYSLDTHTLVLMPAGMTLNKMGALAKDQVAGAKGTGYRIFWSQIDGDQAEENSYWFVMTRDVFPESRGDKSHQEQLDIAKGYECKSPTLVAEAPSLLEAAVGNFVEHKRTGTRLFSDEPWTYTCCRDAPIQGLKLIVGGFAPSGLSVSCSFGDADIGVAAVVRRKFN